MLLFQKMRRFEQHYGVNTAGCDLHSKLKTISIKFPKLVDFLKENLLDIKPRKPLLFQGRISTNLLQNPDETYLHMKAREFDQYRQGFLYSMDTEQNCAGYSIHLIKEDNRDIEDLLKPVETLEFDSDGDYSEISDIFEEYHKDSFLRANADPRKKHLSKIEADCKTVERFTDDFKKTMVALRKEQQITLPLFDEEESVERVLNKSLEPRKSSTPPRRESPIVIEQENDQRSETSSESLVWQRLLNNSDSQFKVSPPVYDVFRQEKKHWLERPPIPWKLVDNCRVKCDKWLDDVMRVGGE